MQKHLKGFLNNKGDFTMKSKLKTLGKGFLIAIKSCAGMGFLCLAVFMFTQVAIESGYLAVIAFIAAIVLLIASVKMIYELGGNL